MIKYKLITRSLKSPLKPSNQVTDIDIDLRSERVPNYRDFRSSEGKSWAVELEELQLCSNNPSPGTILDTTTHNGTDETLLCISSKVPLIEPESTINEGKNTEGFCDLSIGLQEDLVDISASPVPALGQRNFIKSTAQVLREEESQPQPTGDNKEAKSTTIHERQDPQSTEDFDLDLRSSRLPQTDPGSVTFGKSWVEELRELNGNSMGIPNRGPMNGCIQYDMPAIEEITPAD
uniref:Uncharacterized protein n=1 Tax=Sphaerodactylus townsendi TaxID=933632 RepID=A0ACB8GBR3_9SAUR